MTHFSQEHLEICCYTQRIILIGYHIFMCINFLLTCLLRGMTLTKSILSHALAFLLTCLLRGMTALSQQRSTFFTVSTHMPLARHDINGLPELHRQRVSTHMPLARHDVFPLPNKPTKQMFLLTCLLRGMTYMPEILLDYYYVSTHMPLARHDGRGSGHLRICPGFYSHASCEA